MSLKQSVPASLSFCLIMMFYKSKNMIQQETPRLPLKGQVLALSRTSLSQAGDAPGFCALCAVPPSRLSVTHVTGTVLG